jgi:hypothetical protein
LTKRNLTEVSERAIEAAAFIGRRNNRVAADSNAGCTDKKSVGCEIPIHAELGDGPLEIGECAKQNGIFIRDCGFDAECAVEHAAIPRISSSRALPMHSAPAH